MIPGSNLLNVALSVIAAQTIQYYRATGRSLNDLGQYVTAFDAPVAIVGSFQPVNRKLYEAYGLDFQKEYSTFYTSNNIVDIQRDVSNDKIFFNNRTYQCESNNDWFGIDGWKGILCCMIPSDT